MDYDRYKEIRAQVRMTRHPWQFAPKVRFVGDGGDWENIATVAANAKGVVQAFIEEKAHIEADQDLTEEGRAKRIRKLYEDTVVPAIDRTRKSALSEFRRRAQTDLASASASAFDLPTHPYQIAVDMKAIDAVREGKRLKGKARLTLPEIEQLPFETRRALAVAPAHASGLNALEHETIKAQILEESGGVALADAQAFADAVEGVAEIVDYAEVIAEQAAGIERNHPLAVAGAEMREELERRDAMPATEDDDHRILKAG